MKENLNTDELNLATLALQYSDEDKARELLEQMRWPNGPVCPHCRNDGKAKKIYTLAPNWTSKAPVRRGVYKCGACRKQFTVTVNTVFEASHVPISKWMMALFILCSSKKSISAHQLHRMINVTYKTAWFMAHRIRFGICVSGQSKPATKGRMKTSHFEGRIASWAATAALERNERTQCELAAYDINFGGQWLVQPADCA